jgi:hypothetical protein
MLKLVCGVTYVLLLIVASIIILCSVFLSVFFGSWVCLLSWLLAWYCLMRTSLCVLVAEWSESNPSPVVYFLKIT